MISWSLADQEMLDYMDALLKGRYQCKRMCILECDLTDDREAVISESPNQSWVRRQVVACLLTTCRILDAWDRS